MNKKLLLIVAAAIVLGILGYGEFVYPNIPPSGCDSGEMFREAGLASTQNPPDLKKMSEIQQHAVRCQQYGISHNNPGDDYGDYYSVEMQDLPGKIDEMKREAQGGQQEQSSE